MGKELPYCVQRLRKKHKDFKNNRTVRTGRTEP